jgi:hypothetical protein
MKFFRIMGSMCSYITQSLELPGKTTSFVQSKFKTDEDEEKSEVEHSWIAPEMAT